MEKVTATQFKILSIVLLIALLSWFGIDIHLASLPMIAKTMHTNKEHMQQSVSIFLLGMGLSLFVYGPLSDKYGRKPVVICGLAIGVISNFVSIYCTNINYFILCRFFQGVGLGVGTGIGRTIFADVLQGEQLASISSYFSTAMSISPLFAPTIGSYLQHLFGWRSNFIFLGTVCLFALILYTRCCPETNYHKKPDLNVTTMLQNYLSLIQNKVFVCATLITGIGLAVSMIYATTSPFILQTEFNLTPIMYGWITMIAGCE